MKPNHPKLKTTRPLFSCGFFRHCTQSILSSSPTNSTPPTPPDLTLTYDPAPPPPLSSASSSSSSSSSATSQSFTQWRFPLPNTSHISCSSYSRPQPQPECPEPPLVSNMEELFHVAELQFASVENQDRLRALHMLERALVPNPRATVYGGDDLGCPAVVMRGVVECLRERVGVKPASKVLLALCLEEGNRRLGVEAGAVGVVVEALPELEGAVVERAMAALELLCTVEEGAVEVREHALAVPLMVQVMGKMEGRGKENAIGVLAVIYGGCGEGGAVAPPEEVARAVMLALQGDCSARARRKGAHLLKILQTQDGVLNNETIQPFR